MTKRPRASRGAAAPVSPGRARRARRQRLLWLLLFALVVPALLLGAAGHHVLHGDADGESCQACHVTPFEVHHVALRLGVVDGIDFAVFEPQSTPCATALRTPGASRAPPRAG